MEVIPTCEYHSDEFVLDENLKGISISEENTYLNEKLKNLDNSMNEAYLVNLTKREIKDNLHHYF